IWVFAALGVEIDTPATGCCGMAGLFGHKPRHQTVSKRLFEMSWAPKIGTGAPVLATGFSCRCRRSIARPASRRSSGR
ncbi:hypothetical protein LZ189_18970, partial [Rhodovulum sulfidophilum]|nr:hypothetical protein [Rhodovulum sulfidophilum]